MDKETSISKFLTSFCNDMMENELKKSKVEMTDFLTNKEIFKHEEVPHNISTLRKVYLTNYFYHKCINDWGLKPFGVKRIKKVIKEYINEKGL